MKLYQLRCRQWTTCTSSLTDILHAAHLRHTEWLYCFIFNNLQWTLEHWTSEGSQEIARSSGEGNSWSPWQRPYSVPCLGPMLCKQLSMKSYWRFLFHMAAYGMRNAQSILLKVESIKAVSPNRIFNILHVRFAKHCLSYPPISYSIKQSTLKIRSTQCFTNKSKTQLSTNATPIANVMCNVDTS